MKKIFTIAILAAASMNAAAAVTVEGSKLLDNISIGINGGAYTPTTNHAFFGNMRPTFGLEIGKEFTPVVGIALEGRAYVNYYTKSAVAIDASTVTGFGKLNLSNLFGGYTGSPRFVEFVAKAGLGWGHYYFPGSSDYNTWTSKFGVDVNFNLGASKAWQINVKPAIVYDMEAGQGTSSFNRFNVNHSIIELAAGVTYKFGNSNGTHNFKIAKLYDQAEVDGLNARVNDLRGQVNTKDAQLKANEQTIRSLQTQLNDCRNAGPKVVTNNKTTNSLESVVTFAQGKSVIERSQLPNVERIATYLKKYPSSTVTIKGYASPEGSAEVNERIAKARAEAVKKLLVKTYKISESRISASGQGVGDMFSEPDWNRVAISTIDKAK